MKKFVCLLLLIVLCASCIAFSACDSDKIMNVKKTTVTYNSSWFIGLSQGEYRKRESYVFDYCYDLDTAYVKIRYRTADEKEYSLFWEGSVSTKDSVIDSKTGKVSIRRTRLLFMIDRLPEYQQNITEFEITIYANKDDRALCTQHVTL